MRSRYYHILILGKSKVNIAKIINRYAKDIKRYQITKHESFASLSNLIPHTNIALEFHDAKLPIWISRRFHVRLSRIELCHSSIIFSYLNEAKGAK